MNYSLRLFRQSAIVALGGFLMGFDVSVIAGVVGPLRQQFELGDLALGWSVASLTLSATLAMLLAGPLSDRFGRLPVLRGAALLFALSAVASALAPDFATLVLARLIGGLAVGAALIVAPIYIGESAPPERRGMLVSINQLNIVIGISVAFFSNYLLALLAGSDHALVARLGIDAHSWRWMLGVEALPAIAYLAGLFLVRESPRWLALNGDTPGAGQALRETRTAGEADAELASILATGNGKPVAPLAALRQLMAPSMRGLFGLCLMVAVLQQLTGINAVFFYAPMVFEQAGLGQNAALWQAAMVGLVNLTLTMIAMVLIDRVGRRPLLLVGLAGMSTALLTLAMAFHEASYRITAQLLELLPNATVALDSLVRREFTDAAQMLAALEQQADVTLEPATAAELSQAAIQIDSTRVLFGILTFVGSFAVSIGPVMWVLLSELMPTSLRGVGVSLAGVVNSAVSFLVQLLFPWQLAQLGPTTTFALFGSVAIVGLLAVWRWVPETKGRSLEELAAGLSP